MEYSYTFWSDSRSVQDTDFWSLDPRHHEAAGQLPCPNTGAGAVGAPGGSMASATA